MAHPPASITFTSQQCLPEGETITAQHAAAWVKSLRDVRDVLLCVTLFHTFTIIRQDKVPVGCVWIRNHIHYK